ncbi:unnamed protein product [Rhodiola kirilowii]
MENIGRGPLIEPVVGGLKDLIFSDSLVDLLLGFLTADEFGNHWSSVKYQL